MIAFLNLETNKNTDYAVINGRWHLNNRSFNELTVNEQAALAENIKTHEM